MKPTTIKERLGLDEDALFEDTNDQEVMTDEELKIESLKIATNIAKLMSGVTPEDVVNIAETVAKFIKDGANASTLDGSSDSENEETEDFEEADEEVPEVTDENPEESEEDFTV